MTEKEIEKYIIDNYFIKNQFEIAEDLGMSRTQIITFNRRDCSGQVYAACNE